jgi:hypothetical protein
MIRRGTHSIKKRLKSILAIGTFRGSNVPRSVASRNDPRCLLTVDRSKIFGQPGQLSTVGGERAGVFDWSGCGWLIGSVGEVGLGIEGDVVNHAMVPGIPKVLEAFGLGGGHTRKQTYQNETFNPYQTHNEYLLPVCTVSGEVQLTGNAVREVGAIVAVSLVVSWRIVNADKEYLPSKWNSPTATMYGRIWEMGVISS